MDGTHSLQCSSLSNIHKYHARDLFRSHAKRTGKTKAQIIATKCHAWQPRPNPGTPYVASRPQTAKSNANHSNINPSKFKDMEIQNELKWLRNAINTRSMYGSIPSSRPQTAGQPTRSRESNFSTVLLSASHHMQRPKSHHGKYRSGTLKLPTKSVRQQMRPATVKFS